MKNRVFEIVEPLVDIFPEYHPDAADINESLDYGVASCAVRAYASALLLNEIFPNKNLYDIQYGYSPEHGGEYQGNNGTYLKMGHAVVRLWIPGSQPLVVESYNNSAIEVVYPNETHGDYIWGDAQANYESYLEIAGQDDIEIRPKELLGCLKKLIGYK